MIDETFDRETLRRLAGAKVFRRGEAYAGSDRVEVVDATPTRRVGVVIGTEVYDVELSSDGNPDWSCSCPYAADGDFCKHCVALALVEVPERLARPSRDGAARIVDEATVLAGYLSVMPADRLREIVIEQVALDARLRTRLVAEATAKTAAPLDRSAWRARIVAATDPYDEYVSWREADGWAEGVADVLDALRDLIAAGCASDVIELAEFAFVRIERSMDWVDDSSGVLRELSEQAGILHFDACEAAPPAPNVLAGLLVDMQIDSELEGLDGAVSTYADLLGTAGLHEYRRLVERRREAGGSSWTLDTMYHDVLSELGDVDALLATLESSSRPGDRQRVIELLVSSDRRDDAIERALTWLDGDAASEPLRDLAASLLRERGDEDAALDLYVRAFERRPSLRAYEHLTAQPGASSGERYESCLQATRAWVVSQPTGRPRTGDVLVEMLLIGERFDDAWRAGLEFGCSDVLRLRIAERRDAEHPGDALDFYHHRAFRLIETKDPKVYADAIDLIDRIRRCCELLGDDASFREAVARARTEHRPKRNVQKLLDQRGW